jgi:hypothetical protein
MQTTNKRSKTDFPYKMKGETLQKVDHQPYLGVELSNNLKYNLHIDQTCKKASKVLGFLKRNLKHCPSTVEWRLSAMSLMNTRNNVGPSTVPWGTPDVTWELNTVHLV